MKNKHKFTKARIEELLPDLHEDIRPLWGLMTPQHMVEHLTISVKGSTGRTRPVVVPPRITAETKIYR